MITMLIRHVLLLTLVISAVSGDSRISAAQRARIVDIKNREIVGITLGESTAKDVERILGPAPLTMPEVDISRLCYMAVNSNNVVLEFDNWVDPVEFRLFYRPSYAKLDCGHSDLISRTLSTESGLMLGLDRKQVLTILGPPTKTRRNQLIYESSSERRLTRTKVEHSKESAPPPRVTTVHVYDKVVVEFTGPTATMVDVLHSETD